MESFTPVDWGIVVLLALAAVAGFGRGLLVGALSLAGFVGGAFVGTRVGPLLLPEGAASPYAPLFGLAGALLGGAILSSLGSLVGRSARGVLRVPGFRLVDGLLGALFTAIVVLGVIWVLGAIALNTPGARELRPQVQRSAVLKELNARLPPTGPLLNLLARFDPVPRIDGPGVSVPPPRAAITRDRDVRAAAESVVRILGTACGLGVSGSGWIAGDGLVVTNAHVVAGQNDTTVQRRGDGPRFDASAVVFDVRNDLAVLRVPALRDAPALSLSRAPDSGQAAAIVGFPRNGPLDLRAARIGDTRSARTQDAYGRGPVNRRLTALRGLVRPGNSGGPVVDARGRVATTVFAATASGGPRGGYGVPNDIVREALASAGGPVETGPCVR